MRAARAWGSALILSSVLAAGSAVAGESLAPEWPMAGTSDNKPIYLEDLRGQITVLCFYDDSVAWSGPCWVRAAQAIKPYAEKETFVLIPVMVAKVPSRFPGLHQRLWGNTLAGGLDCDTYSMSRAAGGGKPSIVIYGPDFEKLYSGGDCYKGNWYMKGPGNPPVNFVALKEGLAKVGDKGLFGGLKVPDAAQRLVPVIKAAQLSNALRGLKSLPDGGDTGAFKTEMTKRIEALRDHKKKIFEDLEKAGDKWGAYKAGSSYVRVFSGEKDTSEIRGKVNKLQWDADVKNQIMAQQTFHRLIPMIYGPRRNPAAVKQKAQLFKQVVDKYKGTEFGDLAAKLAEAP